MLNTSDTEQTFTVNLYAIDGSLANTTIQTVPAHGRIDSDPLKAALGINKVGIVEIVPGDSSAPYVAKLIRHGAVVEDDVIEGYNFALSVPVVKESASEQYLPISNLPLGSDYLELANASSAATTIQLTWYNSYGEVLRTSSQPLDAHSQIHLDAGSSWPQAHQE